MYGVRFIDRLAGSERIQGNDKQPGKRLVERGAAADQLGRGGTGRQSGVGRYPTRRLPTRGKPRTRTGAAPLLYMSCSSLSRHVHVRMLCAHVNVRKDYQPIFARPYMDFET